jgi:hypothetical protein
MKVELTITNNHLIFLVVFVAAIGIVGIAGAYNSGGVGGTPSVMGHSVDEMDWSRPVAQVNANKTNSSLYCIGSNCAKNWSTCDRIRKSDGGSLFGGPSDYQIQIPYQCKNGYICYIIADIIYAPGGLGDYTSSNSKSLAVIYRESTNHFWTTMGYADSQNFKLNGDATSSSIINNGAVYLYDDYGSYTDSNSWVLHVPNINWIVLMYACSITVPFENKNTFEI